MGKSGFWTVVGALASVFAIGLTVVFFVLNRATASKSLEIELLAMTAFTPSDLDLGAVEVWVIHNGERIASYANMQVRVANTGRTPIRASDYESPLAFDFKNVERILSARELASNPTEIEAEPQIQDATNVVLPEILLNSGDWYTIEIELAALPNSTPRFDPLGRIVGVKEIVYRDEPATVREARTTIRTGSRAYPVWHTIALSVLGMAALLFLVHMLFLPEAKLTRRANIILTSLEGGLALTAALLLATTAALNL